MSEVGDEGLHLPEHKDPHEKPFTLFYSRHDDKGIESLKLWYDKIDELLQSQSTGKVAVVLEAEGTSKPISDYITQAVNEGLSPTQAVISLVGPDDEFPLTKYNAEKYFLLDKLNEKYPNRIHLVNEWSSDEELQKSPRYPYFSYDPEKETWEDAFGNFKENTSINMDTHKKRNEQIVQIITDTLALDNIIGGVGLVGSFHTPISHTLIKEGYKVDRFFAEKQEGHFVFSPEIAYKRAVRFFPNREQTDKDFDLVVSAENEIDNLKSVTDDEQGVLRAAHHWIRNIKKIRHQENKKESNEPK